MSPNSAANCSWALKSFCQGICTWRSRSLSSLIVPCARIMDAVAASAISKIRVAEVFLSLLKLYEGNSSSSFWILPNQAIPDIRNSIGSVALFRVVPKGVSAIRQENNVLDGPGRGRFCCSLSSITHFNPALVCGQSRCLVSLPVLNRTPSMISSSSIKKPVRKLASLRSTKSTV